MADNSIKISAGGNVAIDGAVGTGATSNRIIAGGDVNMGEVRAHFDELEKVIDKISIAEQLPPKQIDLLKSDYRALAEQATSGAIDEKTFQQKAKDFCDKMNFACESVQSAAMITSGLTAIAGMLGFGLPGLM